MIHARLSPRAEADLEEVLNYVAAKDPEVALGLRNTILNAADLLALHPA